MNRRKSGEVCADWVTFNAVRDADGTVSHVVGTLTDTTQRKEAEAKIVQLAFYDPLTSLPNRRLMQDRLHQAVSASRRKQSCGALLFIDVDDFKTLNETQGHDVGDLLLKDMAKRLSNCLRDCDTAGRFGGDKFLVMLEDLGPEVNAAAAKVEAVAEKLLHELSQPNALRQLVYQGGASIGITLFTPREVSGDELTQQAELRIAATAFESQQGMVIADANGLILRVNRSFTEITGYGPSEVVGQTIGSFSVSPPAPDFFSSLQKAMGESGTWQG